MDQKSPPVRSLLPVALLCLAAAGCTTSPFQSGPSPSSSSRAPEPEQNPASVALLERSRGERDAGRYAAAAASLERALRIDPNNALLWVELAEVKAADGDRDQAEEMARKALTLAGNDGSIAARARRLL